MTDFRAMRRSKQQLSQAECITLLEKATSGTLAVSGDDGYPYAVPLSFVYGNGRLYFHCAPTGHKLDGIRRSPKVSFCVITRDDVVPADYSTRYQSVIAFGDARLLTDDAERRAALTLIADKYAATESAESRKATIDQAMAHVCLIELDIRHMTGKESRALAAEREQTQPASV